MPTETEEILICQKAAGINRTYKFRTGNIIELPSEKTVFITGDLHGNCRNFQKIKAAAQLDKHPENHVVFQEILHGGPEDAHGGCLSYKLFFQILEYQLTYPRQVHLILGNHDTAIITDSEVLKEGREMNFSLDSAMKRDYGSDFDNIKQAVKDYLISQPLAVRTANKIWISHSLPANRYMNSFDTAVFGKELTADDFKRPQGAYLLTWGRNHSQENLDKMADLLSADFFVLGHQWQEEGFCTEGDKAVILASDHGKGCIMKIDTNTEYSLEMLEQSIIRLAAIE